VDEKFNPIENAQIYIEKKRQGTSTNNEGFFEMKLEKGDYEVKISHINYAEHKEVVSLSQVQNINRVIVLKQKTVLLKEIVVTPKSESDARSLVKQALKQLCAKLDTTSGCIYDLTHSIDNTLGYTHNFQGTVLLFPLGFKINNNLKEETMVASKFFKFRINNIVRKEETKNIDCKEYCFLFDSRDKNNKWTDDYVGWLSYKWNSYIMGINQRILDRHYSFDIQNNEDPTKIVIKISNPNAKKELFDITLILDSKSNDLIFIKYELAERLRQLWNNRITAAKKMKGLLPRFLVLRQKNRVIELSVDVKMQGEKLVFEKITMTHFVEFDKRIEDKSIFKRQLVEWKLLEQTDSGLDPTKTLNFVNYISLYD
jgi:hypothetical protein